MECFIVVITYKDIEKHFIRITNPLEGDRNAVMPINISLSNLPIRNSGVYVATIDATNNVRETRDLFGKMQQLQLIA